MVSQERALGLKTMCAYFRDNWAKFATSKNFVSLSTKLNTAENNVIGCAELDLTQGFQRYLIFENWAYSSKVTLMNETATLVPLECLTCTHGIWTN